MVVVAVVACAAVVAAGVVPAARRAGAGVPGLVVGGDARAAAYDRAASGVGVGGDGIGAASIGTDSNAAYDVELVYVFFALVCGWFISTMSESSE